MNARVPDRVCRCGNPIPPWALSAQCLGCDLASEPIKPTPLAACSTCDRLVPRVDAAAGVLSIRCNHDGTFLVEEVP